jgi:hypothetical protein
MAGHIATAKRTDWCTPGHIVQAVHEALGGPPGLDPCSNKASIVDAVTAWSLPVTDGLANEWIAGTIYVNPPYGRGIDNWLSRCARAARTGSDVIALIPVATDTRHFWAHVWGAASAICFVRGRIKFLGAPTGAPFANAVIYWGRGAARFEMAFEDLGKVVRL